MLCPIERRKKKRKGRRMNLVSGIYIMLVSEISNTYVVFYLLHMWCLKTEIVSVCEIKWLAGFWRASLIPKLI